MKEGWEYKKLGDVCKVIMGQSPDGNSVNTSKGIEFHQGKVFFGDKYLNVSNSFTEQPSKIAEPNSVLLCVRAPVGIVNITQRRICIGRGLCSIQPNDILAMPFLFYALTQKQAYFDKNSTGSTFKAISSKVVLNTEIPIPHLSEQEKIVGELDLLSSVIEKKKAQLKELDQLAQSIFYDMFGDPVTNEKGWDVKTIGEIASFHNGKAHENDIDENGKYILINAKFISSEGDVLKRTNKQLFPLLKNDIVMVMSDVPNGKALAKCYLVKCNNLFSLNQRICAFRNYVLNSRFLFFVLNRNKYYLRFDDGNGQTNLRKNDVLGCPVIIPPLSVQESFSDKIEAIERQKELIKQSIAETETLFNSRMDYYFN